MELTRMAKITVVADGLRWREVVKRLTEVGVRYYHLLECADVEPAGRSSNEPSPKRVLLEAIADINNAPAVARAIADNCCVSTGSSIAVSEVAVSLDYREKEAVATASSRLSQEWWAKTWCQYSCPRLFC
jgi:hypothetical protein